MLGFWASSGGGVEAWTQLTDTPGTITADRAVKGNGGGTALEFAANPYLDTTAAAGYLRRDGSNTITGDIAPDGDQTRRFGSDAAKFIGINSRLTTGLGGSTSGGGVASSVGTKSYGANPTGLLGGNMVEYGSGAAYFRHGAPVAFPANGFKPVATITNVFAGYGGGDASVINNGGGSFLGGSAYTYGSGDALLQSNDFGNFTWAYSYATGAGNHTWNNDGAGATMLGYSQGVGSANIQVTGVGSFTAVRPVAGTGQTTAVTNSGPGAFINGYISSNGANSSMTASATGCFVQGSASNGGKVRATSPAAFAQGSTVGNGSDIEATSFGAMARGVSLVGNAITASGRGSLAIGNADTAAIIASANNAFQFGVGTNATVGSLQVGADIQIVAADSIRIRQNKELRFEDDGGNYVGFEAPALSANQIWILPIADGSDGDVLTTNGAGVLSWLSGASEKAWTFDSPAGTAGTFYFGGFYLFHTTSFTPAGGTNVGSANSAYAAHALVVLGAASTDMVIRVTGTSITDAGVRTTSDTEDIDTSGGSTDDYYETGKKWIGQVSYTLQSGTGVIIDAGFSKYWDNNNTDFAVVGLEATWLGGANDSAANIELLHHQLTGWTYSGGGGSPTPPTALANMNADHVTENDIVNGEPGAWKRTNLSTSVAGSSSEGTIWRITTGSNKAFELGNLLMRITPQ